ncbi:MAG: hypothetical protein KF887_11750 [Paracoccaceae bacterium]|nr:MAG: hypothetical protein KF887_11750 [Paracoccaceae bacterium]
MCDRLLGAALLAALSVASAASAADCAPITPHFDICPGASDWAIAEWEQFGDGAALHLGALTLDFTEHWAARDDADPHVAAALDGLLTAMLDGEAHSTLQADSLSLDGMTVARKVQSITFAGDPTILRATMIVEGGGNRMMLMLTGPGDTEPGLIDARSREVAALIRPAGEGR